MTISEDELERLAYAVRRFLASSDLLTRLSTMPVLYLELPDVGAMHNLHRAIVEGMTQLPAGEAWSYPDDHTIKFEPLAGITIVLSCKQRFAVTSGGSVAYRDIAFRLISGGGSGGP